jgi:hypothetical protein
MVREAAEFRIDRKFTESDDRLVRAAKENLRQGIAGGSGGLH